MDSSLQLEVEGRSMTLSALEIEKRTQERIDSELVAFAVRADREGITPKQRELQMKAIVENAHKESEEELFLAASKDVKSNLKLVNKHIG